MLYRRPRLDTYRRLRLDAYLAAHELQTPVKLAIATGFAGLLALLSQLAIPVPWTPVPLTMQVLGVFLIGTHLGPRYALISFAIYLAAGALGLHVFAPSANSYNPDSLWSADRWRILVPNLAAHTGYTAGYIAGWVLAGAFVAYWLKAQQDRLHGKFLWIVILGLIALLASISLGSLFLADGNTFSITPGSATQYDSSFDTLILFVAATVILAPLMAWLLLDTTQPAQRGGALDLYLVFLAAIAIIHTCGMIVLKITLELTWQQAAGFGSTVFLPFDALKAALGVALSVPFLPTANERRLLTPKATFSNR